ncbi:hypothetical protein [Shinella zoogloeoides]|uniref:hypothetical protein n=1 Tax=Shinella zoogloeoides TaxID=352475 RepID=UPI00273D8582|nr:hypothetical protein [Shinella zoogloeoides]WLR94267.1 hypothetical protein Q9316_08890 [Shinella zoogloeoides]
MMELTPEVEEALDRFALEQDITREEALAVIARDWLIGQGYLLTEGDQQEEQPAEN